MRHRWIRLLLLLICPSAYLIAASSVDSLPPQLYLLGDTLCPGDTYEEAVHAKDFNRIRSMQFQLRWDANAIRLDSVWPAAPFAANMLINDQQLLQGKMNAVWFYPVLLQGLTLPDEEPVLFFRYAQIDSLFDRSAIKFDTTDQSFPFVFSQLIGDSTRMVDGIGVGDTLRFSSPRVVNAVITPGSTGQETGTIKVEVSGGKPPYLISWSTNDTGMEIDMLSPGDYYCTITDENNCEREFGPFVVEETTATDDLFALSKVLVAPNPFSEQLTISSSILLKQIEVLNWQGKTVVILSELFLEKTLGPELASLPKGVYILKITNRQGGVFCMRIVKI